MCVEKLIPTLNLEKKGHLFGANLWTDAELTVISFFFYFFKKLKEFIVKGVYGSVHAEHIKSENCSFPMLNFSSSSSCPNNDMFVSVP